MLQREGRERELVCITVALISHLQFRRQETHRRGSSLGGSEVDPRIALALVLWVYVSLHGKVSDRL